MLGVEEATTSTPGWFVMCLPAMKNILSQMDAAANAELDAEVEKIRRQGYPERVKWKYADIPADADAFHRVTDISQSSRKAYA